MTGPHTTGVWISANSAAVVRWSPEFTVRHRIDSSVPGRHRSTGRPPTEDHPSGEGHRDEHMRTFFVEVAHALPIDDDLLLVGDGEVVEHFAEQVRVDDDNHGRMRRIEVEKAGRPLTERQLLARGPHVCRIASQTHPAALSEGANTRRSWSMGQNLRAASRNDDAARARRSERPCRTGAAKTVVRLAR